MELITAELLSTHYPIRFVRLELIRDAGSTAYAAFSESGKYFLRVVKPSFFDTALTGADIQVFLREQGFPVPPIIFANENLPYANTDAGMCILYNYLDGEDCDPERDAEAIGALTGRLHHIMKIYPNRLVKRDMQFYIGRYIDILQKKRYPKMDEYAAYGDALWEKKSSMGLLSRRPL